MKRSIATLVVALATVTVLGFAPPLVAAAPAHVGHPRLEEGSARHHHRRHRRQPNYAWHLFLATNASRRKHGVHPLRQDHDIATMVRAHSAAMARSHRLFHTADVRKYLRHVHSWHRWGENIGFSTRSLQDVQRAFMASAPHRANILTRAFHRVAVGVFKVGKRYWVTVFFYG